MEAACNLVSQSLLEAVGRTGTVLVPTYSYSIGKGEIFDPAETPSTIGDFTEHFRLLPGAIRSAEPMLSVAGIGPHAESLLSELPKTCYGLDSVYDRLQKLGPRAKILTIGLGLYWATYRHYIEERANVPFRFPKHFKGQVRLNGVERSESWEYFAAPRIENCQPNGVPLEQIATHLNLYRSAPLGRGTIGVIGCQDYLQIGLKAFAENPWLTAIGPELPKLEILKHL